MYEYFIEIFLILVLCAYIIVYHFRTYEQYKIKKVDRDGKKKIVKRNSLNVVD